MICSFINCFFFVRLFTAEYYENLHIINLRKFQKYIRI